VSFVVFLFSVTKKTTLEPECDNRFPTVDEIDRIDEPDTEQELTSRCPA